MKRSKFTDSQIMEALKRVDAGLAVPEICRELGISTATFYKWRAKYGGVDTSMIARMKELKALPLFKKILETNPSRGQFWSGYVDTLIKANQFDSFKYAIVQERKDGLSG